ncbi:Os04g0271401, partial [Oryza sativa Japonica Group]
KRRRKIREEEEEKEKEKKTNTDRVYYLLDGNLWYFEDRIIRLLILNLFALEQELIWNSCRSREFNYIS